jgi:hypothetical protein
MCFIDFPAFHVIKPKKPKRTPATLAEKSQ